MHVTIEYFAAAGQPLQAFISDITRTVWIESER